MVGMRAAERGVRDENTLKVMRACLDMVETLVRQSDKITQSDIETTLGVLAKAATEVDDETSATTAVVASVRNAIGKLHALRVEMTAK